MAALHPMRRTLAVAFACAIGGLAVEARGAIDAFSFHQVNWFNQVGSPATMNSQWGQFNFAYTAPASTQYLNVFIGTSPGSSGAWAIENLPLFVADDGIVGTRTEGAYLDLSEVGVAAGFDWSSTFFTISLDAAPRSVALPTGAVSAGVGNIDWRSWDSVDEQMPPGGLFTDPGIPAPIRPGPFAPIKLNPGRNIRGVQEHVDHCFAGAASRSVDWLNRTHDLGMNQTAQEIYNELRALDVSRPNANGTKARERWIKTKSDYAKAQTNDRIVTKVWDSGGWLDPIVGVTESGGDFLEWLNAEFEHGEDIELIYNWPNGGHIVTLADLYLQGDATYAKYRDDEKQGNDDEGDGIGGAAFPSFKRAKIYFKNGAWRFGSDANKITWAVSESYVPEPTMIGVSTIVLGALLVRRRRTAGCRSVR